MPTDAQRWCAGLPVTRSRSLTVAEMRRIRARRRSMTRKAVGSLLGLPVLVVICAATVTFSPPAPEFLVSLVLVLATFGAVPLCIVMSNDYFKRAGMLQRQCRDSEVLVCEGTVVNLVLERRGLETLRRQLGQNSEVVLEVLEDSGLLWAVDGQPQEPWIVVPHGRTTRPPDQARLAAQYVRPVQTEHGTLRLHQRLLSETECSELRAYLPPVKLTTAVVALLVNAIAIAHLVSYARNPVGVPLLGVVLLTLAGWCDAQFFLLVRARRRMLRDLRDKFVVIYQPDAASDACGESVVELLPHSGAEWTNSGRAAQWRRSYGPTV